MLCLHIFLKVPAVELPCPILPRPFESTTVGAWRQLEVAALYCAGAAPRSVLGCSPPVHARVGDSLRADSGSVSGNGNAKSPRFSTSRWRERLNLASECQRQEPLSPAFLQSCIFVLKPRPCKHEVAHRGYDWGKKAFLIILFFGEQPGG